MDIPALVRRIAGLELRTERLSIRRFRDDDLELAIEHELDPRIMRFIRDVKPRAAVIEKVKTFMAPWKGAEGEWLGLPMTLRGQRAMIGIVAFRIVSADRETVEIGYRMHPDHQRLGLTEEACRRLLAWLFDEARVRKVVACCVAANEPSYRLLEKLGMRREGHLREHSRLGGAWCDELVYGLLAGDRGRDG